MVLTPVTDSEGLLSRSTILLIDDDADSLALLHRLLASSGCARVLTTSSPAEAIDIFAASCPDLLLIDYHMPAMSGPALMQSCRKLSLESDFVPVIVVTADLSEEAKRQALEAGANDFVDKSSPDFEVILRVKNQLRARHSHLALQRQNATLEQQVLERTAELAASQEEVIQRLATAAEFRDDETGKHIERVGNLAFQIATAFGLKLKDAELIRLSAKLHDIGKLATPDSILHKPGPLTPEERETMKTHTLIGDEILSAGSSELIRSAQHIARSHHEKWNGTGYPFGLKGTDIPLSARVVAIADVFDALVTERPYKEALPLDAAREIILEGSGAHFDPDLVTAFAAIPIQLLLRTASEGRGVLLATELQEPTISKPIHAAPRRPPSRANTVRATSEAPPSAPIARNKRPARPGAHPNGL